MKSKLTLRVEESVIKEAKEYAAEQNESLSAIVSKYFQFLANRNGRNGSATGPITSSLTGIVPDSAPDIQDYRDHLETKHS